MAIYNSVVKQGKLHDVCATPDLVLHTQLTSSVTKLNSIREDQLSMQAGPSSSAPTPNDERGSNAEPNRVDTVLADVFALLSLFFLTIGKSRETPAIYCQIASMRVRTSRCRG
jgi:hypothetical protein